MPTDPLPPVPPAVIADRPPDEFYRADLDVDCQCARCGSSVDSERCEWCEDGYVTTEDSDGYKDVDLCDECWGHPVTHHCMSSSAWCQANPLPGREAVPRGAVEWYAVRREG
jgi:hypothetical protein